MHKHIEPSIYIALVLYLVIDTQQQISKIKLSPTLSYNDNNKIMHSSIYQGNRNTLINILDIQYLGIIKIGNPSQQFKLIFDTGSHLTWVAAIDCSPCTQSMTKFKYNQSITYTKLQKYRSVKYGRGYAKGYSAQQLFIFDKISTKCQLFVAQQLGNFHDLSFDGIVGFNNDYKYKNFIDFAYQSQQIISPLFAFQFGWNALNHHSYFYYNFTHRDFPNAIFINTSRTNKWTIPIQKVEVNNITYNIQQVLLDTGTTMLSFPQKLYSSLKTKYFNKSNEQCKYQLYPNINIIFDGFQHIITPQQYLYTWDSNTKCSIVIAKFSEEFIVLGDIFLRHYITIFDKQSHKIGFVKKNIQIKEYFQKYDCRFSYLTKIFNGLYICIIVLVFIILSTQISKNKQNMLKNQLNNNNKQQIGVNNIIQMTETS